MFKLEPVKVCLKGNSIFINEIKGNYSPIAYEIEPIKLAA